MQALRDILLPFGGPDEKVGLALSGGGFRAAFFHVGVLARLAEIGVLPRVEVISTVSGGSIVGATYYLCLQRLLQEKTDDLIGDEDYVALVAEVELLLRDAVQKNIRARVFRNLGKNFQMAFWPSYSRSDRIGDLYDRHLYKPAWKTPRPSRTWDRDKQVEMQELLVEPAGSEEFELPGGNEGRRAKVPKLLINATSLNSGHNWRFEATRMGESLPDDPARDRIVEEVDKNFWLKPGYFRPKPAKDGVPAQDGVPAKHKDFPLGLAVAASAAVPGVFQPLPISGMYEGIRVQLVDGGVQDNQGIQGLFDKECTHLIVSDASGQMEDKPKPSTRAIGTLGRSASIEADRIRDEQLIGALDRPPERYALMHLRKGLEAKQVTPMNSLQGGPPTERIAASSDDFDVDRDVQGALSRIRTDLDYFSDTEAFSLALDGYLMSSFELDRHGFGPADGEPATPSDPERWAFGADERLVEEVKTGGLAVLHTLEAGKRSFFRLFSLAPGIGVMVAILATVALAFGLGSAWDGIADALDGEWPIFPVLATFLAAILLLAGYAADPRPVIVRFPVETALALLMAAAAPFLWVWANLSVLATKLAR